MAMNEAARRGLYDRLQAALGEEAAVTLMEHIPPAGWADLVTRRDLEQRLESTEHKIMAAIRAEMNTQTRTIVYSTVFTMLGGLTSMGALVLAATR